MGNKYLSRMSCCVLCCALRVNHGLRITREPCALKLLFQMKAQEQPNTLDDSREPCLFYWKHKEPRQEKEENAFLAEILISHWNNATNDPWWKVWKD